MFRGLGIVSVSGPDGAASFSSPRERTVFSTLVANTNQVVSIAKIVDVAREGAPPSTAREQVHIRVSGRGRQKPTSKRSGRTRGR